MFQEPYFIGQRRGWVEIVCGCMFSGKTEELIRRIKRSGIAGQNVQLFKPNKDIRYSETDVVSHSKNSLEAIGVNSSDEIYRFVTDMEEDKQVDVVGIDEAQFFDNKLPEVAEKLANDGIRVILAGLDMDYRGEPFDPMPELLARAEFVTKVHAICRHCGNLATHSYRKSEDNEKIVLGESDIYEARCRKCFNMGLILDFKGEE